MKRILIATLMTLAAAPVLAVTPSFNDHPEQSWAKTAGVMGKAAADVGRTVSQPTPQGANY